MTAAPSCRIDAAPAASGRARAEGDLRSLAWRAAEALFVRDLVDAAHAREARVVVAGDLNDVAESVPVRAVRGEDLVACGQAVPRERRFSILHHGVGGGDRSPARLA